MLKFLHKTKMIKDASGISCKVCQYNVSHYDPHPQMFHYKEQCTYQLNISELSEINYIIPLP
jgi:hypothetical protein